MKELAEIFADLLDYPTSDWRTRCDECKKLLSAESQTFVNSFDLFSNETHALSLADLQELYTRTFDLNPVCTLDIGYHLFGENYKRGVFLANLRETEVAYELGQKHQLPDYLPVLLRLVSKLEDEELRMALIAECMVPALVRMLKPLTGSDNPYRYLVELVHAVLKSQVVEYPTTIERAHLRVLADDPGNHAHLHQREQPQSRLTSDDYATRFVRGVETSADLF